MASKVYFTSFKVTKSASYQAAKNKTILGKLEKLFFTAEGDKVIQKNDFVALKLHIGEPGNTTFLRPQFAAKIVEIVKNLGGRPFLTDCNTLYRDKRCNAVEHHISAIKHGFSYESVGAPFIVGDGLFGEDYFKVSLAEGIKVKSANIGSVLANANSLIVLTHFKGHEATGFGGALKNVGMGGASRSGKQIQHSDLKPKVKEEKCTGCWICIKYCPVNCIEKKGKVAFINQDLCIGCGECVAMCPPDAIPILWNEGEEGSLQQKIAEYTLGALKTKNGKSFFINFLMDITPDCDCMPWSNVPFVPDIGILASFDPVAIDKASTDLINNYHLPDFEIAKIKKNYSESEDNIKKLHKVNWQLALEHGEKIGLGTMKYELKEVQ